MSKKEQTSAAYEKKIHGKETRSHVGAEAAAAASGAAIGAVVGAAAGPPGIVAGALVGGVLGAATGIGLDRKTRRDLEHDEQIAKVESDAEEEIASRRAPHPIKKPD